MFRQAFLIVFIGLVLIAILVLKPSSVVEETLLQAPTRSLTVMLYPYIPDANNDQFAGYIARVEQEFEALYPEIDLRVIMDPGIVTYDTSVLERLYTPGGPDLIEIDLMMLGYVQAQGWITPVNDYDTTGLFQVAINAAALDTNLYAMPTRVCSLFLFAYNDEITQATSTETYVEIIQTLNPGGAQRGLLGSFYGETSLPTYYTSFFGGIYGAEYLSDAFINDADANTTLQTAMMFNECTFEGENHCLNTYYTSEAGAPEDFANGEALSYIGFSESLNYMVNVNPTPASIAIAPFGNQQTPVIYADGLTVNTAACGGQCALDAELFGQYYASVDTQLWTNLAWDTSSEIPRYLLAAQSAFYAQPEVEALPAYSAYLPAIVGGTAFPSVGFPEARPQMFPTICENINVTLGYDACLMPSELQAPRYPHK